ncbi:MAG: amidohydrolase family protein [Halanaerobiaceae bacterium]|nr:amidohydrolase family protein [Halanaerobiaceae bacterium]
MFFSFYRRVIPYLLCFLFCLSISFPVPAGDLYDIVILNGRVIDPETERDEAGLNIGINGRQIVRISREPLSGKRVIDATGLVVVPGFIDPLSYDPNPIGSWYKLADGVTTNLALHGGAVSPAEYFEKHNKLDPPLNYGTSFFVAKMRSRMQPNPYLRLTSEEIEKLAEAAEKALKEGAMAISFSLEYYPGTKRDEIVPLMKLAAEYNVPVFFHLRYSTMFGSGGNNIDGINEVLDYARETGAAIHIDHINSTGGTFSMEESLALLRQARAEGLRVTACTYPYNYWATRLSSPRFDEGWQERFRIDYDDLQLIGHEERMTEESFKKYRSEKGVLVAAYAIPEEDLVRSLKEDYIMIGSDGMIEPDPYGRGPGMNNHPRGAGCFSRVIAKYVRDEKVISLMDAVKKMTLLPAQLLEEEVPALRKMGRIQEGMDADIVVFNYDEIEDKADIINPAQYSEGIYYVLVNGQVVIDEEGIHRDVRAGELIRSYFD